MTVKIAEIDARASQVDHFAVVTARPILKTWSTVTSRWRARNFWFTNFVSHVCWTIDLRSSLDIINLPRSYRGMKLHCNLGRLPFDQNCRNFRNGDKWYVNFLGKVPENSEIVEFPKRERFNRKFRKFTEIMRISNLFYSKLVLWATITARWTSHAGMMWTNIQKWTNILVWNLATCLSVL